MMNNPNEFPSDWVNLTQEIWGPPVPATISYELDLVDDVDQVAEPNAVEYVDEVEQADHLDEVHDIDEVLHLPLSSSSDEAASLLSAHQHDDDVQSWWQRSRDLVTSGPVHGGMVNGVGSSESRDRQGVARLQTAARPAHSSPTDVGIKQLKSGIGVVPASPDVKESYVSPGRSAAIHWRLVVAFAAIAIVLGSAAAAITKPSYSAEQDLFVGNTFNLNNTATISGFSSAAAAIAQDYSRLISNGQVVARTEQALGHPGRLDGSLSATAVPQTPEIRVLASGHSRAVAVALAKAGSVALIDAINNINETSAGQLNALLSQYQQDEKTINANLLQIQALQSQAGAAGSKSVVLQQIASLQALNAVLTLQANAVQVQYQNDFSPVQQETQVISPIAAAYSTGSNRGRILEMGALIGGVVGLLLGVAYASLIDLRRDHRSILRRIRR